MVKFTLIILMLLLGGLVDVQAAAVFKGIVVANEVDGDPVAGVSVGADGANQQLSLNDGSFVLNFPDKDPGDLFLLQLHKPGWVIVNAMQLQGRPLGDKNSLPFKLVVAPREQKRAWALKFYRLIGEQAVEQQYQLRLAKLQGTHEAVIAEYDRLSPID